MPLFQPSGGLSYHWRGWTSARRWQSYREQLASWLENWPIPKEEELLLIGPSAGYSLPTRWLAEFAHRQAFDIDPLASYLFQLRHGRTPFRKQNLFFTAGELTLQPFRQLLSEHPRASVLFCNILGQLPVAAKVTEPSWLKFLPELRQILEGRRWASYHDLWTLEPLRKQLHQRAFNSFNSSHDVTSMAQAVGATSVLDHGMNGEWKHGLESSYFAWSLTDRSLHILEGTRSKS